MLYYLHIPKSAGTSVRHLFQAVFRERLVEVYGDLSGVQYMPDSVLFGHFCFGAHNGLRDAAPSYMTLFRDPVERVISWYRHQLRDVNMRFYRDIRENGLSLGEIIERGLAHEVNNHSVRTICSDAVYEWQRNRSLRVVWTNSPPNELQRNGGGKLAGNKLYQYSSVRHLKLACERIRRYFCFVGVVERVDLLINFLAEQTDKTPELKVPNENVAPNPDVQVDAQTVDLIKRANRLDYELFEMVQHGRIKCQSGC